MSLRFKCPHCGSTILNKQTYVTCDNDVLGFDTVDQDEDTVSISAVTDRSEGTPDWETETFDKFKCVECSTEWDSVSAMVAAGAITAHKEEGK